MDRGYCTRDNMRLYFEAEARHANRILDVFLPINNIPARDDMDNFAVGGYRDGLGYLKCSADVILLYIPMAGRNGNEAFAILGINMAACYSHISRDYFFSR